MLLIVRILQAEWCLHQVFLPVALWVAGSPEFGQVLYGFFCISQWSPWVQLHSNSDNQYYLLQVIAICYKHLLDFFITQVPQSPGKTLVDLRLPQRILSLGCTLHSFD